MKKGGFLSCESMEEENWSGWRTDVSPCIGSWKPPWASPPCVLLPWLPVSQG